jgi:hypothetical protein
MGRAGAHIDGLAGNENKSGRTKVATQPTHTCTRTIKELLTSLLALRSSYTDTQVVCLCYNTNHKLFTETQLKF